MIYKITRYKLQKSKILMLIYKGLATVSTLTGSALYIDGYEDNVRKISKLFLPVLHIQ